MTPTDPDRSKQRHAQPSQEQPTATAPDSVHESVSERADDAGKAKRSMAMEQPHGAEPDAADPPRAREKAVAAGAPEDRRDDTDTDPGADLDGADLDGADLDPDEGADAFETRAQAEDAKDGGNKPRQDEDIISLDGTD